MIGGYDVFGKNSAASTTLADLPDHSTLAISFTLFIGDSWDTELFYLYVDDVEVKAASYYYGNSNDYVCGEGMWAE